MEATIRNVVTIHEAFLNLHFVSTNEIKDIIDGAEDVIYREKQKGLLRNPDFIGFLETIVIKLKTGK